MTPRSHATGTARLLSLAAASVALSACAVRPVAPLEPVQSRASYEAAVRDQSTSPSWVLITLAGDGAQAHARRCTYGRFLIGAIMRESGANASEALQLALANRDHVFRFSRQAALDNVPARYSESELADARATLAPFSVSELRHAFSSLAGQPAPAKSKIARAALACALLERGLSPRTADLSGQIYVEPLRPRTGAPVDTGQANTPGQ